MQDRTAGKQGSHDTSHPAMNGVWALPPGVDFATAFVRGLRARMAGRPAVEMARITVLLPTHRLARRITEAFAATGPGMLPRLVPLDSLPEFVLPHDLPPAGAGLKRLLDVTALVEALIREQPDLAPPSAALDLADSLTALLDEMALEGVTADAVRSLDVSDQSGHWQRALTFLDIVFDYLGAERGTQPLSGPQRLRIAANALMDLWRNAPPRDPVIVAGSTASRAATRQIMAAAAGLDSGCVVLPGFDFDLPGPLWADLPGTAGGEDHPQFRLAHFLQEAGLTRDDVRRWTDDSPAAEPRNRLLSLSLRPAPVTDEWLREAPRLRPEVQDATSGLTLLEAEHPREEARAIALILREVAETERSAALITPDRTLARRVIAELDRWQLKPDDSAGRPLGLTPPGLLLNLIADGLGRPVTPELLLSILKHPLVCAGKGRRGEHLRNSRNLERFLRRAAPPFLTPDILEAFARDRQKRAEEDLGPWTAWVTEVIALMEPAEPAPPARWASRHAEIAEAWARGPAADADGQTGLTARIPGGEDGASADAETALWKEEAGPVARNAIADLQRAGEGARELGPDEYRHLWRRTEAQASVRDRLDRHPRIRILGTIEARVGTPDLVILAGLNEGTWPGVPAADPWLNRSMRAQAGLLLPERRIGLAAHDYQMAIAAPLAVISRSIRSGDSSTVPSRWLNRLTNLLSGMGKEGSAALAEMRLRGQRWLDLARQLDRPAKPVPREPRPSPRPPADAQPDKLSATQIARMIRDPYTIYAQKILGLYALPPLRPRPDALLRGTVLHRVVERFSHEIEGPLPDDAADILRRIAKEELANLPWATAQHLWMAQVERFLPRFLEGERQRRDQGTPQWFEVNGTLEMQEIGLTLTAKADRIDLRTDGSLAIYDYKTGAIPDTNRIAAYDKQMPVEILIASSGRFVTEDGKSIGSKTVSTAGYIALGRSATAADLMLAAADYPPQETRDGIVQLISAFRDGRAGYTPRMRLMGDRDHSDYDHLSRLGEWSLSDLPPEPARPAEGSAGAAAGAAAGEIGDEA